MNISIEINSELNDPKEGVGLGLNTSLSVEERSFYVDGIFANLTFNLQISIQ